MKAYIYSDILIWHLRGDRNVLHFLRKLKNDDQYELWIGAMQRAEVVFFMRPGEEDSTELFLSQFKTSAVDQPIIDMAGALYRKWNPSHGIDVNDAILAAIVMQTGGRIYCLNIKHYPMPDILVQKAW